MKNTKKDKWLTADDVVLILQLHKRGASTEKIADVMGLSTQTILRCIQFDKLFKEIREREQKNKTVLE